MKKAVVYVKWLPIMGGGEAVSFSMVNVLKVLDYQITVVSADPFQVDEISHKLSIDFRGINFERIFNDEKELKKLVKDKDLFINSSFMDYSYGFARKNIYYVHFPTVLSDVKNAALLFFQKTQAHLSLPAKIANRINTRLRAGIFFNQKKRLKSYNLILANSYFTKSWVKKLWQKDAKVLYPPVKLIKKKLPKKNWITTVGRFFTLGHGKKQEILIQAFKALYNKGLKDFQLHLVGGIGSDIVSQNYIKILKKQAERYPIFFHLNSQREELETILAQSKIYWHATGYGENETKNPLKFEHFGISAIEAISAGCLPVLYNGGGLKEIISLFKLNPKVFLFETIEQLVSKTIYLIKKPEVFDRNVINDLLLRAFSFERFEKEFAKILSDASSPKNSTSVD